MSSIGDRFRSIAGTVGAQLVAQFVPGAKQATEAAIAHEQFLHWAYCLGIEQRHALEVLDEARTFAEEQGQRPSFGYQLARDRLFGEILRQPATTSEGDQQ
jgi:hypothetical protein